MDEEKIINKYVIETNEDGYVTGFYAVLEGHYDYEGQMADFPEVCEGWSIFENNTFVIDEEKKAEIIAEREAEAQKPTQLDIVEAQAFFTAMMTDTLIDAEEEE